MSAEPLPTSPRGTSEETTTVQDKSTCRDRAAPVAWSASSARRGVAGLGLEEERCNLDLWRQNGEGEGDDEGGRGGSRQTRCTRRHGGDTALKERARRGERERGKRGADPENLAEDRRREERRVLDDDHVALVLVRNVELVEEEVGRLADAHRAHKLAADPCAAAGSDAGLDDRDLELGASLGEDVGGRQAGRAGADCESRSSAAAERAGKAT